MKIQDYCGIIKQKGGIFMTDKIYTLDEIKAIITPVAEKYDVEEVYLFGSYARGEATEKSDIDFVMNFSESISLFTYAEVIDDLENLFGKKVDIVSHNSAGPRLLYQIIEEEVLMYA